MAYFIVEELQVLPLKVSEALIEVTVLHCFNEIGYSKQKSKQ